MFSALINTLDRPDRLDRCLAALAGQQAAGLALLDEAIVVDDGGTADLGPIVARHARRLPLRLERIAHAGRAAARNHALALARGRRVLFLGDDVLAGPELLAAHGAEADPDVAVVGPYPIAALRGSPPFRRWAEPNPQHLIQDPRDAGPFFFATGNLSADRERLVALGGFDARFELYGWEDVDLGLRFARAGGRTRFEAAAAAIHDHPGLDRAQLWDRERQMGWTAWQFAEKWRRDEPTFVARMQFWDDPAAISSPSPPRRRLGAMACAALDALAPGSRLNARLYERMVFSHRLEGVAQAWRAVMGAGEAR
jgi:GT2 family glycosyltransferase